MDDVHPRVASCQIHATALTSKRIYCVHNSSRTIKARLMALSFVQRVCVREITLRTRKLQMQLNVVIRIHADAFPEMHICPRMYIRIHVGKRFSEFCQ